jgi:hypothetical protein
MAPGQGQDGQAQVNDDVFFEGLARLVRTSAPGHVASKDERRARTRFLTQASRRAVRFSRSTLVVTLVLTAAVLGGWRWLHRLVRVPAATQVASVAAPAYTLPAVTAPAPPLLAGGSVVRFTDGSELRFDADGRGRVAESTRAGARVVLEDGGVAVEVVHRDGAAWRIEAGPFTVRVTGTKFRVAWQRQDGRFDLAMSEGEVIVEGPTFSQRLVAGQVMQASTAAGIVHLGWDAAKASTTMATMTSASAATTAALAHKPRARGRRVPTGQPRAAAPSWARQLAQGNLRAVVDEARASGVEQVFARRGLDDLQALCTAARLSGETELGRRALAALRTRFPATPAAAEAAFLLGRLAEDVDGNPAGALLWYERALDEAPAGTLAPEVLGRKLGLLAAADPGEARVVARQYLARFPTGAHAVRARALAQAEPGLVAPSK